MENKKEQVKEKIKEEAKSHTKRWIIMASLGCIVPFALHILVIAIIPMMILMFFNPFSFFKTKKAIQEAIENNTPIASISEMLPGAIIEDIQALVEGEYPAPDGNPQPADIVCDSTCTCTKHDYAKGRITHRDPNSILLYDGWTIDADKEGIAYIDCDFGKFAEKSVSNGEQLFEWKVSDYKQGNQEIHIEQPHTNFVYGNKSNRGEGLKTRTGEILPREYCEDEPSLALGDKGTLSTVDGRLEVALGAMATAGSVALNKAIIAKNLFHIGSHYYKPKSPDGKSWSGTFTPEEIGGGSTLWLNLWDGSFAQPKNGMYAYVDVVFEHNETGKQVVVPMMMFDSKNIAMEETHNLRPQFVDQRYGQVRNVITKEAKDFPKTVIKLKLHEYKVIGADTSKNYLDQGLGCKNNNGAATDDHNNSYIPNGMMAEDGIIIPQEGIIYFDDASCREFTKDGSGAIKDTLYVYDTLHTVYELRRTGKTKEDENITYYASPNDEWKYQNSDFLELMDVWVNSSLSGNVSYAIASQILDGHADGHTKVNWHLKATRVYNKSYEPNYFKNKRNSMPTSTISSDNKIIRFCDSGCKCTICRNAEGR